LNNYLDEEEATKIRKEFMKFSEEKLKDINKNLKRSEYILKGEDNFYDFKDEEKENAKNTLEKYQKMVLGMALLEDVKFENLRPNVTERTHKQVLKAFAKSL